MFDSVCELVQSALDGYHVCLFSYGQTGAGKTFTMSGGPTPEQQGIMPRAVQQVRALRRQGRLLMVVPASLLWHGQPCKEVLADFVHCCLLLLLPQILASVAQLTEQEWQYTLTASCIEVYNNQLRWARDR